MIHFNIKFKGRQESTLFIRIKQHLGQYTDLLAEQTENGIWVADFATRELPVKKKLRYKVSVRDLIGREADYEVLRASVDLKKSMPWKVSIFHEIDAEQFPPLELHFLKKINQPKNKKYSTDKVKNPAHIFKVECPPLQEGKFLCITGSAKKMNGWDDTQPVFFKHKKRIAAAAFDLSKENFPVEYKLAVYDAAERKIIAYEPGPNRQLKSIEEDAVVITYLPFTFTDLLWKGAGVNVPVSALRSAGGWGTGDFTDIKLLADWSARAGFTMIQLLPVNDTTALHTERDSYPYSPISSRALHPQFMDVHALAESGSHLFSSAQEEEGKSLDALPFIDQPAVMKLKIEVLREIFAKQKEIFITEKKWLSFFKRNEEWLTPYAAFCYLRDKHNDISKASWGGYEIYNPKKIEALTAQESDIYPEILFWYFIQFKLHRQLKAAARYANKKGIILKADLPIGMDRNSVDVWMHPEFFDLNMQAGAPPDAFTPKGQNWGFPTYNWDNMEADNYKWFTERLQHPQQYFDALRIDHVLGLFRIWSIPAEQREGILGHFVPMLPAGREEFISAGIDFNEERLCNPFVSDMILAEKFGEDVPELKPVFFC